MFNSNIFRSKEAKTGLIILVLLVVAFLVIWFVKSVFSDNSAQSSPTLTSNNKLGLVEDISFDPKLKKYTLTIVFENTTNNSINRTTTDTVTITVEEQLLDSVLKNYEIKGKGVSNELVAISEKSALDKTNKETQKPEIRASQEIVFKVQFLMSKKYFETTADTFQHVNNISHIHDGEFHIYYSGSDATFVGAQGLYKKITPYFPEAFIVAFKNGERIPVLEAKKILRNSANK